MYSAEKLMNFRWIAKTVATISPYVLQAEDMVPQDIVEELSLLGQFAETVYICNSTKTLEDFLFAHIQELTRPGLPFDCYTALLDADLVSTFHGTVARLPATIFHHRPSHRLILSISGTSSLQHAYYDVKTNKHRHPSRRGQVHSGFWRLYKGLRGRAVDALRDALDKYPDVNELVVTGHSMGGVVCHLLLLDLLADESLLPVDVKLKICAFGSPRPGDAELARYWKELVKTRRLMHGEDSFTEYLVKAYNDGVPALPPLAFGFRHFTETPFYLTDDHLYRIPEQECECTLFNVQERASDPTYPKGGHNYYNGRPIERFFRRVNWLEKAKPGVEGWEERYKTHAGRHERWDKEGRGRSDGRGEGVS
ncbi:Alpha/Beta hydrolase protein [Schizophyllum amplum]|uniref:Alpha/Beta hydrolase protein n=1 Tax=Schizophyllum amplum TaxID=97359 RepID=A0A550CBQ1_9AGAR|nr:Alpha/Beta hydrolase protein [Auriculariopsis ampla]